MLTITDLRAEIDSKAAQAAFDVLHDTFTADGFRLEAHEQGFLNSLRIWRDEDFAFAMVPNADWVLAYIRKPELRRERLTVEEIFTVFPEARLTKAGEVTLRIADAATATRWVAMVQKAG